MGGRTVHTARVSIEASAGEAGTPGAGSVSLELWRPRGRFLWFLVGIVAFLVLFSLVLGSVDNHRIRPVFRVLIAVVAAMQALRLLLGARQGRRTAFGRQPWVELDPARGIVVHDRILLREPLVLPRTALTAWAVDAGPPRRHGFGQSLARFALPGSEPAFLWGARAGSRLPQLGQARDLPNLALVLDTPVAAPAKLRRPMRGWYLGHPPRGRLGRGEPIPGLLLTLADPARGAQALSGWPGLAPLAREHLANVPARSRARGRQRRWELAAIAAFGLWTAMQALGAAGVFD